MYIPPDIARIIGARSATVDEMGMSASQVICFEDMVLKIEPRREESENERRMMSWLAGRLPVPRVLAAECEAGINYLLMTRMPGRMSCSPEYLERPSLLIKLLADGLRALWAVDVDVADCPSENMLDCRLRLAGERLRAGLCSTDGAEPETYGAGGFASPAQLYDWLVANRPEESLVLSHGDYCLPNVFFDGDALSGFIDLGRCGRGSRWQDIALCFRSLGHNFAGRYGGRAYDGYHADMLFDELGITPDRERLRYYILLDELA